MYGVYPFDFLSRNRGQPPIINFIGLKTFLKKDFLKFNILIIKPNKLILNYKQFFNM